MTLTHSQAMKQPAKFAAVAGLRLCDQAGYETVFSGPIGVRVDQIPPPR